MKHYLIVTILSLVSFAVRGQDIPDPMSPPRLVNDFAGIYSESERNDLEYMLRNYYDTTSTQIYVVTVTDLGGYDVSDYAPRLGEKWGVGTKGKDNGAVILIKPRIGNERGSAFIATGYGLEPVLTDGRVGRIIDEYMIPYFREDNYYAGTKAAVETMIAYLSGQFVADKQESDDTILWIIAFIIFVLIVIYAYRHGDKGGGSDRSSGSGDPDPSRMFRRTMRGGGSGGSVFRGGGGGRFGGGGAGRSW